MRLLPLFCLFAISAPLLRADTVTHEGTTYYVYEHDPAAEKLELWLPEQRGKPNTFPQVAARAKALGRKLTFAMNAGIYEPGFLPSGLHISEGKVVRKLNTDDYEKTREGELTPNFFLKPNGVFLLHDDGRAAVLETSVMAKSKGPAPRLATQSGPLLVQDGRIHPVLNPGSTSTRYRNGVGVTGDGRIFFACSVRDPETGLSNLHHFASLFRDKLDCPDALYLDGDLSYVFIDGETPPIAETNWFAGIFVVTEAAP